MPEEDEINLRVKSKSHTWIREWVQGKEIICLPFVKSASNLKCSYYNVIWNNLLKTPTIPITVQWFASTAVTLNYSYLLLDDPLQLWFSSVFLIQQGLQDAAWSESCCSYDDDRSTQMRTVHKVESSWVSKRSASSRFLSNQ